MSVTNVITTTRLDFFYQQFLRSHFCNQNNPFQFPKGHFLNLALEYYLTKPPENYRRQDYGEETFIIEVPRMEFKNADYYNYLSERKQRLFADKVREFAVSIINERINKMKRKGFTKEDCIVVIMEDYDINPKYSDRIRRAYSRYMNAERLRAFRKKNKKKYVS